MDPHARATTWDLVRDLRDRGVTVLLTTHAMDEAEHALRPRRDHHRRPARRARLAGRADRGTRSATRSGSRPTPASTSTCSPRRSGSSRATAVGGARRASTSCAPRARRPASPTSRASCATATRRSPRCSRAGARSKTCSCRSPRKPHEPVAEPPAAAAGAGDDAGARRAVARRADAAAAARREPHRHARGPARHPRVLRQGRHDDPDRLRATRSTSSCPACSRSR